MSDDKPTTDGSDATLEELAAMAAESTAPGEDDDSTDQGSSGDDLTGLSDDIRGDLSSPTAGSSDDGFDFDDLEAAVGRDDDAGTVPPEVAPEAPGPEPAPDPATAVGGAPDVVDELQATAEQIDQTVSSDSGVWDEGGEDAGDDGDGPVSIRPDHGEGPGAGSDEPLDPTNFTASGRRVGKPGSGGDSLVDKIKGLFGR